MRVLSLFVSLLLCSCNHRRPDGLQVINLPQPDYPVEAREQNVQGSVEVNVFIGTDGKVIAAVGKGTQPTLVHAAEQNARSWIFGPFNTVTQFPINHKIMYRYELCDHCKFMISDSPIIRTYLPDSLDIISQPLASGYPAAGKENR